jgi:glycosyltransferase involved in cell wall biosynthesis
MRQPDISIVVCTYRRPENLRRVLASIAGQQGVTGRFEVVVADDGSDDETPQVVDQFRDSVSFPVRFVTHKHQGFCPGRCRNEGVAAAQADYVLLLDGDCMIPPDHLRIHLERRQPGVVWLGDHVKLEEAESAKITPAMAYEGSYPARSSRAIASRMWRKALKASWYKATGNVTKPRLTSNNVGIWRKDYLRVNGFDENYVGWGCEDDDMGIRLRRAKIRLESILWWTWAYHLWHPPASSVPLRWKDGPNVAYFSRGFHLVRCGNGVEKRLPSELSIQVAGELPAREAVAGVLPDWYPAESMGVEHPDPEIEILFAPNRHGFSGRAQCNLLIVLDPEVTFAPQYARANLVLCDKRWPQVELEHQFGLHQFEEALCYLLHNKASLSVVKAIRAQREAQECLRVAAQERLRLRSAG